MKKFFLKIRALFLLPVLAMTVACDDWFTLLPQSEMVAEDFWKDEQDVLSGVGACYSWVVLLHQPTDTTVFPCWYCSITCMTQAAVLASADYQVV